MPIFPTAIPELTTHIIDPIVKQSILRLIDLLGYRELFKDNIDIRSDWMRSSRVTDIYNNTRIRSNVFTADVVVQMNPQNTKWPIMNFRHTLAYGLNNQENWQNYPVFVDPVNNITLQERASPCSIVMTCRMSFLDKSHGYQTSAMLYNRYSEGSVMEHSDFFYDYPIPGDLLHIFDFLYKMKANRPATLYDYLRLGSNGQISKLLAFDPTNKVRRVDNLGRVITKPVPNRTEVVVNRANIHCLHSLEYNDESPQAQLTGYRPNQFDVSFIYTVQFNIPNHLIMSYPIIVDQKLVPSALIPIDKESWDIRLPDDMTHQAQDKYYQQVKHVKPGPFITPTYDDWLMPTTSLPYKCSQRPFYQAGLLVDTTQDLTTVDLLGDLGDGAKLHPVIREIIRREGSECFASDSLIQVAAFSNVTYIEKANMQLLGDPADLVVAFPAKKLNKIYHLVINQPLDIWQVNRKWWYLIGLYNDILGMDTGNITLPTQDDYRGIDYGTYKPFRVLYADIIGQRPGQGAV